MSRREPNYDKVTRVNSEHRATMLWVAVALLVFAGAYAWKKTRAVPEAARADWQRSVSELTNAQQRVYRELRAGIRAAENERARTGRWPELDLTANAKWSRQQQRLAINYLADAEGLRWLVLFLEPDPRATEAPPPDDDEHHTLSDGTPLHVTVWTQPLTTPRAEVVTAFPAAEGWVERVAR